MLIWSAEIKELESLYTSIKGRFPELEKELEQLIQTKDANVVMLYSRRCLEIIVSDLCNCELKRPRKTEPLKGIIDKLHHEEKVPGHIISSMHGLNELSTYGAHPKEFDPEQVKPVLNNLTTIIKWYLKYKDTQKADERNPEEVKYESKELVDVKEGIHKSKKKIIILFSGLVLVVIIVIVSLFVFNVISKMKQSGDLTKLEKSIAVLPFENMSDNEEHAYFGDAMTDEIIMQLYKINEFNVRSRTSVMQYKETKKTIPVIGQELKVNYLIEGSAQRFEDQVRIRVQLIYAATDNHIWGETYEGNWKDILSVQSEIAKQIAGELKTVLTPEEVKRIEDEPTENIEAYNLYLKGRYFWNKRTKEDLRKSIIYFEEAIKIDTAYALAYTGLADSYIVLGEWSYYPPNEVFPKAKKAAMTAIELDYELAEAHNALAAIKRDYEWDWNEAEKEYLKAIELNPNYPTAYQWYSEYLSIMGRHDEAIENLIHAQELDPLSPIIYTVGGAVIYYNARQFDKAILQCQKVLEMDSNYVHVYYALAINYMQLEMFEEAIKVVKKELFLSGDDFQYNTELAMVYALSGKRNEAEVVLNEIVENSNKIYTPATTIVKISIALNRKDQALDWLEKAYLNRDYGLIFIKVSPLYDNLRDAPRFIKILKEMELEE